MGKTVKGMTRQTGKPTAVVGIGASAGGLEALQQFLTFLSAGTGMAFVIIQHLSPEHKSMLSEILSKYTSMHVAEAEDGMEVMRNHVYLIPPKYNLEIVANTLYLRQYDHTKINHPIDIFFRSLAKSYENRAVAVILSGTGSDGTNGIKAIREQNGVIIVQSPESAKFDGMPRNAIATGYEDMVLNPDGIAREMMHISHSMLNTSGVLQLTDDELLTQIFSILRSETNVNYTFYKQTTILRRIERRMVVTHNHDLREYVTYLRQNPEETKTLAKEVLIGVTAFFRDASYFEVLKDSVASQIVREARPGEQIRIWVAGCSTGEEAYSIAIVFAEVMEELSIRRDIKIFATDLDVDSIAIASRGVYSDNIIEDVSVARLSKYFSHKGSKYVINADIRRMIVFAQHNVFQDPPFGKLDLISCRNLLIYFQNVLQKSLFAIFHLALKDKGYLFLGSSESVSDYDDIFRVFCASEKIFLHNADGKMPAHSKVSYSVRSLEQPMVMAPASRDSDMYENKLKVEELDTKVLEELLPACVLVDEHNLLTHSFGDCSKFLQMPVGSATLDIFSLIRTDLKIAVSKALKEARATEKKVVYDKILVSIDGENCFLTLVAMPVGDKNHGESGITAIALIHEKESHFEGAEHFDIDSAAAERITNLERDLHESQDNLKSTVSELESVNAELQAANEELMTANEELQSSNEELQSVNEELYTVNSEYQEKVAELADVNDDMANFLSTTLVGILMVDNQLNVRKYTEYIAKEFNMAEQDVGRSLRYIACNFNTIDLMELSVEVQKTKKTIERTCASIEGKTYLIRIAPYHTHIYRGDMPPEHRGEADKPDSEEGRAIDGLVITFVDTTKQVGGAKELEEISKALQVVSRHSKETETFLSHLSHDLRVPVTAVDSLIDLSLTMDDLPEAARNNLLKIKNSTTYMLDMLTKALESNEIETGNAVAEYKAVPEESVLHDVHELMGPRALQAKLHFKTQITGCENRLALIDTRHLSRILVNLLDNSMKFTPEDGTVELELKVAYTPAHKTQHVYIVRDTGCGLSPRFQQRMYMPFEQEARDSGIILKGSGLGLFITKSLVDMLGGIIVCESQPGVGTAFTLTFTFDLDEKEVKKGK